jgi:hypothetical protein
MRTTPARTGAPQAPFAEVLCLLPETSVISAVRKDDWLKTYEVRAAPDVTLTATFANVRTVGWDRNVVEIRVGTRTQLQKSESVEHR